MLVLEKAEKPEIKLQTSVSEFPNAYCNPKSQILNKTGVDLLLEVFWFFNDPADIGNLILVPLAFQKPAWLSGSSRLMYFGSMAWIILSINLVVCEMSATVQ